MTDRSSESSSEKSSFRHIRCLPSNLELGRNYIGAKIQGSFQVLPAASAAQVYAIPCGPHGYPQQPVPDWLELHGPHPTPTNGLVWGWTIHTETAGTRFASLAIECDTGRSSCQISLELQDGEPAHGDIVLCDSPFSCDTTSAELAALMRVVGVLDFRVHCVNRLSDITNMLPQGIVLHGGGLIRLSQDDRDLLDHLVRKGTNLIVFADEFFRGTTSASNMLLTSYDMEFLRDGTDDFHIAQEVKIRRLTDWRQKYTEVLCTERDIITDPLTSGVRRLHWFRPCPLRIKGPGASPLVRFPSSSDEFLAAISRPKGNVVAVGKSLISSFASDGWPYDNDRLLANLMAGGDAETLISAK
jgi:hypothetical protein